MNAVIGVPDKDVVGLVGSVPERQGAIVTKVDPGVIRDCAGYTLFVEKGLDERLCIIRGARVTDSVRVKVDIRPEVFKGVCDNVALILDNHRQTDGLSCSSGYVHYE